MKNISSQGKKQEEEIHPAYPKENPVTKEPLPEREKNAPLHLSPEIKQTPQPEIKPGRL